MFSGVDLCRLRLEQASPDALARGGRVAKPCRSERSTLVAPLLRLDDDDAIVVKGLSTPATIQIVGLDQIA
jgi:hypothetical protein